MIIKAFRIYSATSVAAALLGMTCTEHEIENKAPITPYDPNPANNATNVSRNADLSWRCEDPDADIITYDVYFGTGSNPPAVKYGCETNSYDVGMMNADTTYYWKIVANDDPGNQTPGSVWHFTTGTSYSHGALYVGTDNGWVTELRNAGFDVETTTTIPADMSPYNLVVVNAAGTPGTAPYMKTYISNGGGAIIIAPYTFVGGNGTGYVSLAPIADWYGANSANIYYGSFTAKTVIDYPFGSAVPSGTTLVWFSNAAGAGYVSGLNPGVTAVATVNNDNNKVYVHYHTYGSGRVVSFLQGFSSARFPYSPPQGDMTIEADQVFIAGAKWAGGLTNRF